MSTTLKNSFSHFYFKTQHLAKMRTCSLKRWVAETPQHTGSVSALLPSGFVPPLFTLGRRLTQNGIPQDAEPQLCLHRKTDRLCVSAAFNRKFSLLYNNASWWQFPRSLFGLLQTPNRKHYAYETSFATSSQNAHTHISVHHSSCSESDDITFIWM